MEKPPVDKAKFIELTKLASCNVIMSTHDGFYQQIDGLGMGSPPAPHLANGWMSQFDEAIQEGSKMYSRYMDDVLRDMKTADIDDMLARINNLHPNLAFTIERECQGKLPFLDMLLIHEGAQVSTTWYSKPTDTGLVLNFHSLAPKKYKRSVVSGFVHRIMRACSSWQHVHKSLEKAKSVLEKNQYPPAFYNPIIKQTLTSILSRDVPDPPVQPSEVERCEDHQVETPKCAMFLQYRGKGSEDYARSLHKSRAPCTVIFTLRKLKTVLPSLKPAVEKNLRSGVVYRIQCAKCSNAYVGQTARHILTRFKEHLKPSAAVAKHMATCSTKCTMEDVKVLASSARGEAHLLTLEALFIEELKPQINTKEEWKSRQLTIKFF